MPRSRDFDDAKAMQRAMLLFWKKGYASTSLRELLETMGIGESSFYNTFKSKRTAFLTCLKHYDATVNAERVRAFTDQPTASLGIRAFFASILDCLDDPKLPRVCLLAGSITPDVLGEKELRGYVREQASSWAAGMSARFDAEKKQGLLPRDFDSRIVATILVTFVQGLWRLALISYDRGELARQVETLLVGLRL